MAPVRDAVGLVDHQEPHGRGEQRQHPLAELGIVQPLRADQQQVDGVRGEPGADVVPLLAVGAVDGVRAQSQPARRGDLVAHQGQQRADDQGRARAGLPQERGGDEVHRGLSPPCALHAQHPRPIDHDILDRLELPRPELRVIVGGQRAQPLERGRGEGSRDGGAHMFIVARRPEGSCALFQNCFMGRQAPGGFSSKTPYSRLTRRRTTRRLASIICSKNACSSSSP